ncbi:MAG: hypothetical protein HXM55_02805, partial [Megasphaera micronuciformis]|nr:hypothetical protein [Megasphaera micronuciformis]
ALVCIISNQRHIRRLEAQLEALKEKKVEEESVPDIEPAIHAEPETKTNEKALVKAENERPLAIVKTNHEKVSESEKSLSGPIVEDGIDEETVAVIAAAVVACGYVPLAVRKAHRHKRRHTKWVMAGRLAGMR